MRIRHDILKSDGKVIPYIYIELVDDYEFGKDFWTKDTEGSFVSKLKNYVKTYLSSSDKAVLIVNGVMIGTMSLGLFLGLYDKEISKETCEVLDNSDSIEISEIAPEKKEETLNILEKTDEEKKEEINNISKTEVKENITNTSSNTATKPKTPNIEVQEPQNNKENVNKPQVVEPESNKTEITKPEITQPETAQPETTKPEESEPEESEPEVSKPEDVKPEETKPEQTTPPVVEDTSPKIKLNTNGTIIEMNLEEYIVGVVGAEMPASFNAEALKAQAVAARTYAMKKTSQGRVLVDSVSDQVYKTNDELRSTWGASFNHYYNKVRNAVYATEGQVMLYNGKYIDALYHSMSNGKTELPKYIWNSSYPYLVSVNSSWDQNVKNYSVTKNIDYATVSSKLGITVNSSTNIEVISYTESSRVNQIKIGDSVFTGVQVRTKLGLRSTDFTIVKTDTSLQITTRGYGHGVGMSQYGANEMAKQGYGYAKILTHYYTGITIGHV